MSSRAWLSISLGPLAELELLRAVVPYAKQLTAISV
jgi:hypothetical protein